MKKTTKRQYTRDELIAFINRADTREKLDIASAFISKLDLPADLRDELDCELMGSYDMLNDPYYGWGGSDEEDYGPSNPWDAPGMRVSDFITGVCYR